MNFIKKLLNINFFSTNFIENTIFFKAKMSFIKKLLKIKFIKKVLTINFFKKFY